MKDRQPIFVGDPKYKPDWEITMRKIEAFDDVVLTDEQGNEIVTSGDNPNLGRLLIEIEHRGTAPERPR
ncbi:hypothetical protein [Polynucleobacter sp.]|uniref:hypothetical protein n=1 Tax=Polynucleobacter sp. TaxID=2029855 RepID=UPI003F6A3C2A